MVSKKEKLIFLTPPKTASKSLKECLLDCSLDFEPFENTLVDTDHLYLSELVKYFDLENLLQYKIIQVVRSPYDRFVSAYISSGSEMSLDDFAESFYNSIFNSEIKDEKESYFKNRAFLNQTQWNDMRADVVYLKIEDVSKNIKVLSDEVGVYLPELETLNSQDYERMNFSEKFIHIINKIYKKDIEKLKY